MKRQSIKNVPWTGEWGDSRQSAWDAYFDRDEVIEDVYRQLNLTHAREPITGEGVEIVMDMKGQVAKYSVYTTRLRRPPRLMRCYYHCSDSENIGIPIYDITKPHSFNDKVKVEKWHLVGAPRWMKKLTTNFDYFLIPHYDDAKLCRADVNLLSHPDHLRFILDFVLEVWSSATQPTHLLTVGLHTGNLRSTAHMHIKMRGWNRKVDYFIPRKDEESLPDSISSKSGPEAVLLASP